MRRCEAPPAAVLLVGVLDKVGTFGMIRYCLPLFPTRRKYFTPVIIVLAVIGILYGALLAIGQTDMMRLVAYTSISHFGFIVLGIFAMTTQGRQSGSTLYMVNHGFSTAALFLSPASWSAGAAPARSRTTAACRRSRRCWPGSSWSPGCRACAARPVELRQRVPGAGRHVHALPGGGDVATIGIVLAAIYVLWMYQRMMTGPATEGKGGRSGPAAPRDASRRPADRPARRDRVLPEAAAGRDQPAGHRDPDQVGVTDRFPTSHRSPPRKGPPSDAAQLAPITPPTSSTRRWRRC
jgi:NADH-quinone oxidoreductase subunit M